MRAKGNQIPEKCGQCIHFSNCGLVYYYSSPEEWDWATWTQHCKKNNWFEWESKLTKYDFEELG